MKIKLLFCLLMVSIPLRLVAAEDLQKPMPFRKSSVVAPKVQQEPHVSEKSAPAAEEPVAPAEPVEKVPVEVADDQSAPDIEEGRPAYLIEVGTRILHVNLLDDSQGTTEEDSFIGSLTGLDADQNYSPVRPYVQVLLPRKNMRYGVGMSYDHMEVATVDDGGGDGDIDMTSLHLYLVAAYTGNARISPYGEVGVAFYDNSFEPHADWSEDGKRTFKLDSSTAPYLAAGCTIRMDEHWSLDVYLRYVDVDVDGHYVFRGDERDPDPFTFTLEHLAYGLGLKYVF